MIGSWTMVARPLGGGTAKYISDAASLRGRPARLRGHRAPCVRLRPSFGGVRLHRIRPATLIAAAGMRDHQDRDAAVAGVERILRVRQLAVRQAADGLASAPDRARSAPSARRAALARSADSSQFV